ncbi:chromosome partitioning protein [Cellulosimicrobium cellulans]|uniref:non-specific protein-tyrosine kinase n=1 Tax=Cellulosimicrobium cellulans TaxID=1710 RepID=A0A1Y0HXU8_CELCE|nr:polysaccharide biosynthesis tyrosine autokinase [Cellulosimicrobium cellulans]ARU53028.1 chromosome partitioning protein [Cellulosimicrobium cellulans]
MELRDYLVLLRKRWVTVVVAGALGLALAGAYSLLTTPTYSARSQVYVSVQGSDSTTDLLQGSNFTVRQVKSYIELVTSPRVLDPVIEELGLADGAGSLAQRVRADSPLDTALINVTATDESPQLAAEIANATARSLAAVVGELETPAGGGDSPVQISTVRAASVPASAASPNVRLNLALGLVVGLALGVAVAVVRELLDTRVRSTSDVEDVTTAPVLGVVGYDEDAPEHPLIVQESPQAVRAEAFRRLRTNLQFLELGPAARTYLMTSALPGEGKTTTSINLAITLADAGQRVVLVDADLRRPSIARYLGVEGSVGLTTILIGKVSIEDAVQPWGNGNLDVIASGQIPPNPSELLGAAPMAQLLDRLRAEYDVIVIDSPPLLPVTDAAVLAKGVGGAIVVVGAGTVHRNQLETALSALGTVGVAPLGIVVNRVPVRGPGAGAYEYAYREYTADEPSPSPGTTRRGTRGRAGGARRHARRPAPQGTTSPTGPGGWARVGDGGPSGAGPSDDAAGGAAPDTARGDGDAADETAVSVGRPVRAGTFDEVVLPSERQ